MRNKYRHVLDLHQFQNYRYRLGLYTRRKGRYWAGLTRLQNFNYNLGLHEIQVVS